jgi:malonyl-CoA/methylmalonyl-CoA synthetase
MTLPLIARAHAHADREALRVGDRVVTYRQLLDRAHATARRLQHAADVDDLAERAVVGLVTADDRYVVAQWATFRAGGMWVPLALSDPTAEIERVLDDSKAAVAIVDAEHVSVLDPLCEERGISMVLVDDAASFVAQTEPPPPLTAVDTSRAAMMLFTSGTTSRPKGVVISHDNLTQQLDLLTDAWRWSSEDQALLFLPLHHVHGLVNVLGCGLYAGARVTMLPSFQPDAVWDLISRGEVSVLMAVPTVYHRLLQHHEQQSAERVKAFEDGCRKVRLMVSGSAALPVPVFERWERVTGHRLLERYGMTEIGMALSNPYDDDRGGRQPGTVGFPLPSVQVRVRADGALIDGDGEGELEVSGPSVFRAYFDREEATREAFTDDGWFVTGDRVRREGGRYAILGRSSIDILKTGGYKVSALEIENVLLAHDAIAACAVVGLPDDAWGEALWAAVELSGDAPLDEDALRTWAKERLAPYKVPRRIVAHPLPRNAMGKVQKPALIDALAEHR